MSFITFEGIDKSGKSTIIQRLKQESPFPFEQFHDPSSEIGGGLLRELILNGEIDVRTRLYLYLAARSELTAKKIKPALEEGKNVICDRFIDSTTVYQFGYTLLSPFFTYPSELNDFASHNTTPDLTILIDLPAEVAYKRGEADDKYELAIKMHMNSIRTLYLKLAKALDRFEVIDGDQPEDIVYHKVLDVIKRRCDL